MSSGGDDIRGPLYLLGGGLFLFGYGIRSFRIKRTIEDIPRSPAHAVAIGPAEVHGKIKPGETGTIQSPITRSDCVFYEYTVSQGSGKQRKTVASGRSIDWFRIADDSGSLAVNPEGATVSATVKTKSGNSGIFLPETAEFLKTQKVSLTGFLGFSPHFDYTETVLLPDSDTYILGTARPREGARGDNATALVLEHGDKHVPFMISTQSENDLVSWYNKAALFGIPIGILLSTAGLWLLLNM